MISTSGYHIYCLLTNTTTIEGWEKDKVATLIRRGKIREVRSSYFCKALHADIPSLPRSNSPMYVQSIISAIHPIIFAHQNLGIKENLYSVLGPSPLYWPFPIKEMSSGLKFRIADGEGKWIEFHRNGYEMGDVVSRGRRHTEGGRDSEV